MMVSRSFRWTMAPRLVLLEWLFLLLLVLVVVTPTTTRAEIIELTADEFYELSDQVDLILDVRTSAEWLVGHIDNATFVESLFDQLLDSTTADVANAAPDNGMATLQRLGLWNCRSSCRIIVYCRSGRRAGGVLRQLEQAGFTGQLYNGMGILQWTAAGYELVTGPSNKDRDCMTTSTTTTTTTIDSAVSRQGSGVVCGVHTTNADADNADNADGGAVEHQRELDFFKDMFVLQMERYNATGYSFLLTVPCFCPPAGYPWLVTAAWQDTNNNDNNNNMTTTTISNDVVLSAITSSGTDVLQRENLSLQQRVHSILDLFDKIQQAIDQEAASINVVYNQQWGYPEDIFIDRSQQIADEEFYATAANLTLLYDTDADADTDTDTNDNNPTITIGNSSSSSMQGGDALDMETQLTLVFGSDYFENPNSIQSQALDWLQTQDTFFSEEEEPDNDSVLQRFVMVYLYMSTSQQGPWISCNPPEGNQNDFCYYQFLVDANTDPFRYTEVYWTRWLTGAHECDWAGVVCDDDDQVTEIFLDAYDLTGSFPARELAQLHNLNHISMTHNTFAGTLPTDLAQLTNLTSLELQSNQFSGLIPTEWSTIDTLTYVNVGTNKLIGSLPSELGLLTNLERFFVQNNELTGSLPPQLFDLTNLKWFFGGGNTFVRTIPTEIGKLSNLEYFFLRGNAHTGEIPSEIGNLSGMREISLADNFLSGTVPEELYNGMSTWLNLLDLSSCQLSGTISTNIGLLDTCDWFLMSDNRFTGTIPTEASLMTGLKRFFVDGNDLTGTMPSGLCALRSDSGLRYLKADCATTSSGEVPVFCPSGCCTECCNQDTGICLAA